MPHLLPSAITIVSRQRAYFATPHKSFAQASTMTISVRLVVGVPFRTMGFSPMPFAPVQINKACNRFEMIPVNTRAVATKMVKFQPFWYEPFAKFIRKTVSFYRSFPCPKYAVAIAEAGSPQPTVRETKEGAAPINFGPEAVNSGIIKVHRKLTPFGAMWRGVATSPPRLL